MPQRKIPCEDCQAETESIEELGNAKVVSCTQLDDEPGWCLLVWEFID